MDHQEEDNKRRAKIDISCHLPSLISTRLLYSREFVASIRHYNLIFFRQKIKWISFLSLTPKLLREKRVNDRSRRKFRPDTSRTSAQLALKYLVRRHFGFVICTFVRLPRRSGPLLLPFVFILPPSSTVPLRSKTRFPSFSQSLSLFFSLSLYLSLDTNMYVIHSRSIRILCVLINSVIRPET